MLTPLKVVVGLLMAVHGLVHLPHFAANSDEKLPFTVEGSWLLPEGARGPVAIALVAVTVLGSPCSARPSQGPRTRGDLAGPRRRLGGGAPAHAGGLLEGAARRGDRDRPRCARARDLAAWMD